MHASDRRRGLIDKAILVVLAGAVWPAAVVSAHPLEHALTPATTLSAWTFEPGVVAAVITLAAAYTIAVKRCATGSTNVTALEIAAFVLGWVTIVAALVSPIDALGSALSPSIWSSTNSS